MSPTRSPVLPETLHPALWLGHQLGSSRAGTVATGHTPLDGELPGGGWPRRGLVELLLAHPGVGEMRLVAPALAAAQRAERLVMMFDPPAEPVAGALVGLGLDVGRLLVVRSLPVCGAVVGRAGRAVGPRPAAAASCWALEQVLKSGQVGAIVAWLPARLPASVLRRLQGAAARHDGAAFVLREPQAALRPSPAPLRLQLQPAGPDRLEVRVLKRRGPPLESPLVLPLPPVLSPLARRRVGAAQPAPQSPQSLQSLQPPQSAITAPGLAHP